MENFEHSIETIAIHHGYEKDQQRTMAVPIYQSTAYDFGSVDFAKSSFDLGQGTDNVYTRVGNPTTAIFEKRFAKMEGGSSALAVASGMSAIFYSIINIAEVGDNIIVSSKLYGGTVTLFTSTFQKFGIQVKFFDSDNLNEIENLIDEDTKAIYAESLSNPSLDLVDLEKIAEIGEKHQIITIIDNTVATPILCRPISHGIDVVIHSASKYTTGQGLAIGGIVVERPNLFEKIKDNEKYPHFNEPDPTYNNLVYANPPVNGILFTFRMRMALLRDIGAVLSPFNAWIFIQGLETLSLRMQKHSENALKVAEFLESHKKVKKVNYPKLKSSKYFELSEKYLKDGASGLLSFEVNSFEEAKKIVDEVKIFTIVANIGDSKSIITHPASTTHAQLTEEELKKAGVSKTLIRLSIGLENANDLINDLKIALD
jgi:O-acetylhomoserine (thiol)-lyase